MKVPLSKPCINDEMINEVVKALKNEKLVGGESVESFETQFSDYIGTQHAVAVNSGTSAIFLILKAMGIKQGDYVIVPSATFIATVNSVFNCGALPLFADIEGDSNNISPNKIVEFFEIYGKKIKAIMPVHLYGRPANMKEILEIGNKYNVPVIEDACQAHGAKYKGEKTGSIGYAAAFSFYSSKNMTVGGDGGMVTTNDKDLADKIKQLRNQGSSMTNRYLHEIVGYNFRLNSINAAIGKVQLKYIDIWNNNRNKIAKFYYNELKNISTIKLPNEESGMESSWHLFVIRTHGRDKLSAFLKQNGIETGVHYPIPIHLQPAYKFLNKGNYELFETEKWSKEVLSLPIFNEMTIEEAKFVSDFIKEYYGGN